MRKNSLTALVHDLLMILVTSKDTVVDMTLGNGHDTLFLSTIAKKVYSFDIQMEAIESSKNLIGNKENVELIHDSHTNILTYLKSFKGAIYNLGYLPKGNKEITTLAESTIKSLQIVLNNLLDDGFVLITVYRGHSEGYNEHIELTNYLKTLPTNKYQIITFNLFNDKETHPYVIYIKKI